MKWGAIEEEIKPYGFPLGKASNSAIVFVRKTITHCSFKRVVLYFFPGTFTCHCIPGSKHLKILTKRFFLLGDCGVGFGDKCTKFNAQMHRKTPREPQFRPRTSKVTQEKKCEMRTFTLHPQGNYKCL